MLPEQHDVKSEGHREAGRALVGDLPVNTIFRVTSHIKKSKREEKHSTRYIAMRKDDTTISRGGRQAQNTVAGLARRPMYRGRHFPN